MKTEILYRIERHPYGWLVFSGDNRGIPLDLFSEVTAVCKDKDAVIDSGIGCALRALMAFGSKKKLRLWAEEINQAVDTDPHLRPSEKWLYKTDIGISALSIYAALIDNPALRAIAESCYGGGWRPDVPKDFSDFGRCQRLLDLMPAWEEQLGKVAELFPATKWKLLAPRWPELKALYRAEKFVELTQALRDL